MTEKETSPREQNGRDHKKGYEFRTFKGVFTPSILTILGVIMYLRFGWVIGNVGLWSTLLIVTLSCSITFLTALSISTLATNMKVGGGGTYFIISRSLGLEAGAAVGIPLYFAQAFGIAFYIAGFAEALTTVLPFLPFKLVALTTLVGLAILAYISADIALKTQFFILGAIALSLISFFLGKPVIEILPPQTFIPPKVPFWEVFAVFFPAVTGIEAGLAMSGDLKNPAKSLPIGTVSAVTLSYAVYMAIPVFIDRMVKDPNVLRVDFFIMEKIAWVGAFVIIGVFGATLSSAMGAILGAPRTLQALAKDKIIPSVIGKGYGPTNDPRFAAMISFGVGVVGILAGDLNMIAPILSMFFLTAYGLLNLSAAFEGLIGSPSWRPKFKIGWGFSMAGAIGCFTAMFMINAGSTLIAILISAGVYILVKKRQLNTNWSDMRYGLWMLALQHIIYKLEQQKPDERNWRPNLLVLSGPPTTRWPLIELANAITYGRGFLTVSAIVPEEMQTAERLESLRGTIRGYLREHQVKALVNVHSASNVLRGADEIVRTYGFGPVIPNLVLLGESGAEKNYVELARLIQAVHHQRRNLLIFLRKEAIFENIDELKVEVLWGGKKQNAGLMLALAHLICLHPRWNKAQLVLKTVIREESEEEDATKRLNEFIKGERLRADAAVVLNPPGKDVFETIAREAQEDSLLLIGMRPPEDEETEESYAQYYEQLIEKTRDFPPTVMVLASENMDFSRIFESAI